MKPKWTWLLVAFLLSVSLVACGQAVPSPWKTATSVPQLVEPTAGEATVASVAEPTGTPTPLSTAVPTRTPSREEKTVTVPPTTPVPSDPSEQELVVRAKEDLAGRLAIGVDQIKLVEAQAVDWSDTSLGCPKPGRMYAQVITPGFRIVLEVKGRAYEYHTDRGRVVVLCENASLSGM